MKCIAVATTNSLEVLRASGADRVVASLEEVTVDELDEMISASSRS